MPRQIPKMKQAVRLWQSLQDEKQYQKMDNLSDQEVEINTKLLQATSSLANQRGVNGIDFSKVEPLTGRRCLCRMLYQIRRT